VVLFFHIRITAMTYKFPKRINENDFTNREKSHLIKQELHHRNILVNNNNIMIHFIGNGILLDSENVNDIYTYNCIHFNTNRIEKNKNKL